MRCLEGKTFIYRGVSMIGQCIKKPLLIDIKNYYFPAHNLKPIRQSVQNLYLQGLEQLGQLCKEMYCVTFPCPL